MNEAARRADDAPLLEIDDLRTYFHTEEGEVRAVDGIHLAVAEGETLGIVGESGSGKSVTAYSVLRLVPENVGRIAGGAITWRGGAAPVNLAALPISAMPRYRGAEIAMIFQEPMTSLNPVFTCGKQISESLVTHKGMSWTDAEPVATRLLDEVGIPKPAQRMKQYPHELSGGMKQRVMIAMALACDPKLLICDEPTTALDVTIQKQILELIRSLQRDRGMAVLFITHDLGVVAEVTDQVAVMCPGETLRALAAGDAEGAAADGERGGQIVEFGSVVDIFTNPRHPYTKGLIACRPRLETRARRLPTIEQFLAAEREGRVLDPTDPDLDLGQATSGGKRREKTEGFGRPLLGAKHLRTWFPVRSGVLQRVSDWVKAVDDVSLQIPRGKTLGLVGESGCGKTTLGRTLLRLVEPREGDIVYDGVQIEALDDRAMRAMRRRMQIIFQDPYSSLNPRLSIEETLTEPMRIHGLHGAASSRRDRAVRLLERVGLKPEHLNRYPHEFSGGQRQRIGIARTLAVEPEFIVCDESVSALDVSIQAGIINLLLDLQDELGLTYLFISHDLAVVKYVSDEVAVMCTDAAMLDLFEGEDRAELAERNRGGHIVERKGSDALYANPEHPYTRKLLSAIPDPDPEAIRRRFASADPTDAR